MKIFLGLVFLLSLSSCVQPPTRVTEVTDDRPRVTFHAVDLQKKAKKYEVLIDNVSYGTLDQYLAGQNTLPIVSGRHRIEIRESERLVSTEDVTLDANTTRTIRVIDK